MDYEVFVTSDAEADLNGFLRYLLFVKKNRQAATNVLDDFEETKRILATTAGSLKLCDDPRLRSLGYRRMHFITHNYFMLYRIENDRAIVDAVFHDLQDYENKMR